MFGASFFFHGFCDDLTNATSFTNVIAYLDLNVIKVKTFDIQSVRKLKESGVGTHAEFP